MARRALLLANGTYDGEGITQLQSPVPGAQRLGELLARADVGEFDVDVHFDQGTQAQRLAISKFFKASRPGDHQIVHVSGHGFKDEHGKLYFGTRDTEVEWLDATAISARFLHERATESLASQTIIFVDTCYSGAYLSGQMMAGANVIAKDDFIVDGSNGVAIITASSSTQLGWEMEDAGTYQSVFTKHLIEGIRSGAADAASTGKIALDGLFRYISDKVRAEAPGQQPKPFYFGLNPNVTVTLNPSQPTMVLPLEIVAKIESGDYRQRCDACRDLHDLALDRAGWETMALERLADLAGDPDDRVRRRAYIEITEFQKVELGTIQSGQKNSQAKDAFQFNNSNINSKNKIVNKNKMAADRFYLPPLRTLYLIFGLSVASMLAAHIINYFLWSTGGFIFYFNMEDLLVYFLKLLFTIAAIIAITDRQNSEKLPISIPYSAYVVVAAFSFHIALFFYRFFNYDLEGLRSGALSTSDFILGPASVLFSIILAIGYAKYRITKDWQTKLILILLFASTIWPSLSIIRWSLEDITFERGQYIRIVAGLLYQIVYWGGWLLFISRSLPEANLK